MKTKKILLLFTYLVLIGIQNLNAQLSKDSLSYYIDNIPNGKFDAEQLARIYVFLDQERTSYLDQGRIDWVVYYLDRMSEIEHLIGLSYDSEKTAIEALKLLDEMPIKKSHNNLLRNRLVNRIGMILWDYNRYEESLDYNFRLLKVVQSKSDSATLYNNLGVAYKNLVKYDSAFIYLNKAVSLSQEIKKKHSIKARSLDNLGFVQGMLNLEEGLFNMEKALEIRKSNGKDLFQSYDHLTEFYALKKDNSKALFYAKKAYDVAVNNKSESNLVHAMRRFLDLNVSDYLPEYLALNDKILLERQLNQNKFSQVKYNYEKLEEERKNSVLIAEKEKSKRILFQSIGGIITSILISTILILRSRHKKKILIKQFETEQYISKKLHDEVANDVFHTMTKVRGNQTDQPQLLNTLDEIYHKVRDISKSNADLDVTKDFGRLLNDLISSYKTEQVNIFTKGASKIVWNEVSEVKRKMLYRVLQELMVNMRKHSQASLVTLNFEKDTGKLKVRYVDNGVGSDLEKGSGLTNTESRMEMIGGAITFESEIGKGFRANLTL